MAELGETNDPKELVPGDNSALQTAVAKLSSYGDMLHEAGAGLKRIDTTEGWSGKAADQFRDVFHGQPAKWLEAGDSFHAASKAADTYSSTLTWAQGQATSAIRQWNAAQVATNKAKGDHATAPPNAPFNDPGEAGRQAAQDTLNRARHQLDSAGNTAAGVVDQAKDKAPPEPSFWSKVGSGISDVAGDVGHGLANFGKEAVNVLASSSNAALHHPLEACGVAAGALLTVVSAGGEGIGAALDITGVGTAPGLALGAVSTGGIVLGASTVAASATSLAMSAAGEDHVQVFNTDSGGGGGEAAPGEDPPAGVKDGWMSRPARNGKGTIHQRPGAEGDADSVRIADPTNRYPNGYVRFYNEHNQPVDLNGKPGGNAETHIPRNADGTYEVPKGW